MTIYRALRVSRFCVPLLSTLLTGCPGQSGAARDSDGDGFSDTEERNAVPGSDPLNPNDTPLNPIDTDGDGCSDFDELNFEDFCDNDPNTPLDEQPPGTSNRFSLSVARHVDQPLSAAAVDDIFATGGTILQTVQNECPDFATDVTFARNGDIETFDLGDTAVTTEAELDELFSLPQDFKVVEAMVGVCGAPVSDMTTLLGCSFENGSVVIIADAPPDVWAHEWGHVQGLPHRDNCRSNLMHSIELETNAINQRERTAFLSEGPRDTTAKALPAARNITHLAQVKGETAEVWLERIVTRRYLAGIPAELAAELTAFDSRILYDSPFTTHLSLLPGMLADPKYADYRANIIRLAGLAGDVESVPALIASVTMPVGALSREQFNAAVEALLALGRLTAMDSTGTAIEFLVKGTDPQTWLQRGVEWSFRSYQGARLHHLLAKLSIMALGLTKHDAAFAHLRSLRDRIDAGLLDAKFADQVDEAIVRCQGLNVTSKLGVLPMP